MAIIIDGKKCSEEIRNELKQKTEELIKSKGIKPGLALLLVGDNPASALYVKNKAKACEEIGYNSVIVELPEDTSEKTVLNYIEKWNKDESIHGILVQLPLPKQINEQKVILSILPEKDVDGFHPINMGRLVLGLPGFIPCTPAGIQYLLNKYEIPLKGKHVVVVGRSNIVGKPIANLLYQKNSKANAIVTICHTATNDITYYTRQADVLIAAVGVPRLIKSESIKDGATIIDVGINRIKDASTKTGYRLVGDVDYNDVYNKIHAITPVPGGVGPMTIAMLLRNTYLSAVGLDKYE